MKMNCKENHIYVYRKEKCCGCTSCYAACPKNAIMYKEKEHSQYKENIDLIVS